MFKEMLAKFLTGVEGAQWAIIVGIDGVLIEASPRADRARCETLAAEYALFLRACRRVLAQTEGGELKGFELVTGRGKVILESLTPEYFLVVGLESGGYTGKARLEISRARVLMERELVS